MNPTSDQRRLDSAADPVLRLLKLWYVLGALMLLGVLTICLIPLKLPPSAANYNDKVMHVITFVLLTVWFGSLQKKYDRSGHLKLFVSILFYGIAIEVLQSFTAYRSSELADVAADLIGILIGAILLRLGLRSWPTFVENYILRLPYQ